ncbi:MAG: right-handed parallel beta-helix repeat-containing protein [Thermoplasmatales archaeon]|nr:MAG: right-handed parallel beta-helix repeat-containing protein [Thermoplasmatales archaeon]
MKNNLWKKGLVWGIIVLFFGANIIPSTIGLQEVKTVFMDFNSRGNILYVGGSGPNNYTKIQDAIDDASDDDTVFVFDDSSPYYENLVVDKSINLVGEDKDTTVIDGNEYGDVIFISSNGMNISGFTIQNGGSDSVDAGIEICSNHNIISNTIISNDYYGIAIQDSLENTITNNTLLDNFYGVYLYQSINTTITGNSFSKNGLTVHNSYQNTVSDNIVNGKPLIYLEEESDIAIDEEAGQIILIGCNNITIQNQEISNTDLGIGLWDSDNCLVTGNTITSNNWMGLWIYSWSDNNHVSGNTISNNHYGIPIGHSNSNTITNNTISDNEHGMFLLYSQNNAMDNNTISNNHDGIQLYGSHSNTLISNTINSNKDYGIEICDATSNIIKDNTISDNTYGIILSFSAPIIFGNANHISGNTISNSHEGIRFYSSNGTTVTENTILNNRDGIILYYSLCNNFTYNTISDNEYGFKLYHSTDNIIMGNTVASHFTGIYLKESSGNEITYNNLQRNILNAFFINCKNTWNENYWRRPRVLPKPIFGILKTGSIPLPWLNFDWHPAIQPYGI